MPDCPSADGERRGSKEPNCRLAANFGQPIGDGQAAKGRGPRSCDQSSGGGCRRPLCSSYLAAASNCASSNASTITPTNALVSRTRSPGCVVLVRAVHSTRSSATAVNAVCAT